jgi:lysophospholipase L1-like esterase
MGCSNTPVFLYRNNLFICLIPMHKTLSLITFLLNTCLCALAQNPAPVHVTFFGSSVCWGTGAEKEHGYAWQFFKSGAVDTLRFRCFNASTGGDNTLKIEKEDRLGRKLLPTRPDIVVIGLSLGNEGILTPKDDNGRERVLEQYRSRLLALADSLNSLGMRPIVVNCYANSHFTEAHYTITQRMNRIINTWPYPSVNVLGAVDNGTGKWVEGYVRDPLHPNTAGHAEISYTIVPSLFEAIRIGKKIPAYDWHRSYATVRNEAKVAKPLMLDLPGTVHSFTLSFRFKETADGNIGGFTAGNQDYTLTTSGQTLRYKGISKNLPTVPDAWTHVVLSHSYAKQQTQLYVNGELVGTVQEQLAPTQVHFGGAAPQTELKDLTLHRSALNASEVLDLYNQKFIQSSLEFYNPLTRPVSGTILGNEAQSLSTLKIAKGVKVEHQRVLPPIQNSPPA